MNEDIKILREALAKYAEFVEVTEGDVLEVPFSLYNKAREDYRSACDPDRIRRILDDAERALDLELTLRNISYMNHVACELADELDSAGVRTQLGMIRDEINLSLEANT